ncbi:MAG: acyl-CoA dehydrogenase family protein, partial [Spirochaetes bacterium]|nr:acyl-CoA dehydrogenase family protein [Spirochaetota bacterium]
MNYFLTDDQKMIKDLAAQIAKEKIAPIAAELDETGEFPWEVVKTLGKSDLFRVFVPTEYEGLGGGIFEMCIVVEELSK